MTTDRYLEPEGVRARGTVLVFPGRGESAAAYWRFGARIAADAYRVVIVTPESAESEVADALRPLAVVGTDTGALDAVAFAHAHPEVDGVVVAGVPVGGETDALVAELTSRTACAVQQGVLSSEANAPALASVVSLDLVQAPVAALTAPVLALHGEADPVSPLDEALEVYRAWGIDAVTVIADGLHDVLNDLAHRTVAAAIVSFLERVKAGPHTPVIARELDLQGVR